MPEAMKPEVERQIKELLDAGLVVRSDSPMASPLVCVAKKQGGVRLACDYLLSSGSFRYWCAYNFAKLHT